MMLGFALLGIGYGTLVAVVLAIVYAHGSREI